MEVLGLFRPCFFLELSTLSEPLWSSIPQARAISSTHEEDKYKEDGTLSQEIVCNGSQALFEVGVRAGLSLVFALMQQSMQIQSPPGKR